MNTERAIHTDYICVICVPISTTLAAGWMIRAGRASANNGCTASFSTRPALNKACPEQGLP